jgi:CheY-like chemotaxis protein
MNKYTVEEALEQYSKKGLGSIKVLMIEDDPLITELVLTKLSASGCIPYSTVDSREAIDLATRFQPDVIILDLMLPEISGEEILATLKSDPKLKEIPVIIFSNKSDSKSIEYNLSLGAASYLVKAATELTQLEDIVLKAATEFKNTRSN